MVDGLVIHQLIEQDAKKSPWVIKAGCGYTETRKPSECLPVDMTVWASKVTCIECILRRKR